MYRKSRPATEGQEAQAAYQLQRFRPLTNLHCWYTAQNENAAAQVYLRWSPWRRYCMCKTFKAKFLYENSSDRGLFQPVLSQSNTGSHAYQIWQRLQPKTAGGVSHPVLWWTPGISLSSPCIRYNTFQEGVRMGGGGGFRMDRIVVPSG